MRIEKFKSILQDETYGDTTKLKLYYNLSTEYWQVSPDSGLVYAFKTLALAQQMNYKAFIMSAFNNIGVCYQFQSKNSTAISFFDSALHYSTLQPDFTKKIESSILLNKSTSYKNLGNYVEAIDNAIKSLKYSIQENDSMKIAQANLRIANLYDHMGRFDEKVYYNKKAKEYDNGKITAHIYQALGLDFFRHLARYDSATYYLEKAIDICYLNDATRTRYSVQANLAQVQAVQGKLDEATTNCLEAMKLAKQFNDASALSHISSQLGAIHSLKKEYYKSLKYYHDAEKYLKTEGTTVLRKANLNQLATLYETTGNYKEAYAYQKAYTNLLDSLTLKNYEHEVKRITSVYNYEKAENENTILKLENDYSKSIIQHQTSQKRLWAFALFWAAAFCILLAYLFQKKHIRLQVVEEQRDNIEKESANKDRIFSIISHDLKSPFNSIIGLSTLLVSDYDMLTDSKKKTYLYQIKKSSIDSFSLLENLLTWAQIQLKGASISKRPQKLYAMAQHAIAETTQPINKKIIINNLIPSNIQVFCDDSIIVMTLRNLLSNAIKFSDSGKTISIYCEKKGQNVNVIVKDQGVGISPERIEKLFLGDKKNSTLGTNDEKGTGIGLSFCQELLKSHHTELQVKSKIGEGTMFWFSLNLKHENKLS